MTRERIRKSFCCVVCLLLSVPFYSQALSADSAFLDYYTFYAYVYRDVNSIEDVLHFLEQREGEMGVLFREYVDRKRDDIKMRKNETQGIDVFVDNKHYKKIDREFPCVGFAQLEWAFLFKGLRTERGSNLLLLNDSIEEKYNKDYNELFMALEMDTTLMPDIAISCKYDYEYRPATYFVLPPKESITMKYHTWVYDRKRGAHMQCDCGVESCQKHIDGMNRILERLCNENSVDTLWYIDFNWRKRTNNDFVDYYVSRFPKLKTPCIIHEGKLVSQYCAVGDSDKDSKFYTPEIYVGSFLLDSLYVTLKKKSGANIYFLEVFNNKGERLSHFVFSDTDCLPNIAIMASGRIYDIKNKTMYVICPNGEIMEVK